MIENYNYETHLHFWVLCDRWWLQNHCLQIQKGFKNCKSGFSWKSGNICTPWM